MDERDMRILRQLTVNARERKGEIAGRAGVPNYHLTRRMKFFLGNDVISTHRVIVHRNASRLFSTLLFECQCPISVTERFSHAVGLLPFQSTQIPTKEGFLLQTSIPSLDLPQLGSILQKHCTDVKVSWSDYDSSMRYWFWDEAFQNGRWMATRDYMVNDVISGLGPT
jgi:DNA-binding Lrp family transcriptional regulator